MEEDTGFPGSASGEEHIRGAGSIPESGRSPGVGWQPTPVFMPEESHGQRSLAGYRPWGHRELTTTEAI